MYLRTCEICLEIHEFDPEKLFSAPGLACQAALNKTEVKLDLLTDTNVINGRKRYTRRNMSLYLSI